jgi:LysM repeat protein
MRKVIGVVGTLFMLMAVVTPLAAAPVRSWEILGVHEVKMGETLYCIGRAYGVSPDAIASQNGIVNANLIHPGVKLEIPDVPATLPAGPACDPQFDPSAPPPPETSCGDCECASTHMVEIGETLTSIAIEYGVNMWTLAHCNCIYNLNHIQAGAELCIPSP